MPNRLSSLTTRPTWSRLIALAVGLFGLANLTAIAHASCGDYLEMRHGSKPDPVVATAAGQVASVGKLATDSLSLPDQAPTPKPCFSCRGGTIPASQPSSPPAPVRADFQALLGDTSCNMIAANAANRRHIDVLAISEGLYPSILRPPIAG